MLAPQGPSSISTVAELVHTFKNTGLLKRIKVEGELKVEIEIEIKIWLS